ncbi:putative polysaccharide biosynthesis protein [Bacillus taeanensis]|uniref:Polysaccharide biosynthesis protein n=1 Tax=Bacillus taeanensis TaxID=273032 RepID=A0A366XNW2_9BACI|nr:polysaccharide biosynthesis protein [Bacillus taeanensis]RBW67597.1 polysaccharide biosynthesis protein [Bacillus taeanensis]
MAQSFIKGTLILTLATLISKVLGSIFRIPLQNIAGDEVLGIFSLVYPVYMTALILSVAGIPIAISKLISEARAEKNEENVRSIFLTASILAFSFGVLGFGFIYAFAAPLAELLGGQSTKYSLILVSATLLVAPYMAVYRGFFQGHNNMQPTAISQVIEQFVRVGLMIVIAIYLVSKSSSSEQIAAWIMVGSIIGALSSLVYLRTLFSRSPVKPKGKGSYNFTAFKFWSARILKLSIPICIGALTMALINLVDSVTIPFSLKLAGFKETEVGYLYGIYGRGLSLVQIATVFSTSLVLPLIPLITSMMAKKNEAEAKTIIERSFKMTHFISWPAAVGMLVLTLPLNLALFTNFEGSDVLAVTVFSSVFMSLAVLGTGILQGINKSVFAAVIIVVGGILKVVLNFVLVAYYGLIGAAVSTLIVYFMIVLLNAQAIKKEIPFRSLTKEWSVFFGGSIVMGIILVLPFYWLAVKEWTRLFALVYSGLAAVIGAMVYVVFVVVLKGLSRQELSSFPLIGKFFKRERL